MIYTHVLNRGGRGVLSPADRMSLGPEDIPLSAQDARIPAIDDPKSPG